MKRITTLSEALTTGRATVDADGIEIEIGGRTPLPAATISLDTDGTPYWDPSGGTRFVLKDTDGTPFHAASPWPEMTTDTDGTPVISL